MSAGRRGRVSNPDLGVTCVVRNRIAERITQMDRTQAQVIEEMNNNKTILDLLGKSKLSRSLLGLFASGRMLPSVNMLAALTYFLKCDETDLYEPYVLTLIDKAGYRKEDHVKEGSWWDY